MSMWPWPDPTNERIIKLERQLAEAMKTHARDQVRIKAVRDLHVPDEHGPGICDDPDCETWCRECVDGWPCPTIRALDA